MSDNQERSNELPEIIDVDFLPILDDEDYKREKTDKSQELDQTLTNTDRVNYREEKTTNETENQADKMADTKESIKENNETREYIKEDAYTNAYTKDTEYSQNNEYTKTQQTSGYTNYKQTEQTYNQNMKQDTSYASYDLARRQEFRKKKKKFGASILSGIGIVLAIFIGFPILLTVGGTAVFVIGMGIFFSILAIGMGILGLGMAGFTATAGMGAIGMLFLFGSLIALGGGGLGVCIICLMFIGIKNLVVSGIRHRKLKKESQEV